MVVMAITALMSVLGVAALISINNNVTVDKSSEYILSLIREAQNKSFSVATDPTDSTVFPVSWGVKINQSTSEVIPFYINTDATGTTFDYNEITNIENNIFTITNMVGTTASPLTTKNYSTVYLVYSSPFGKFFKVDGINKADPCHRAVTGANICSLNVARPHNLVYPISSDYDVNNLVVSFNFRNSIKQITVGDSGDAYISQ